MRVNPFPRCSTCSGLCVRIPRPEESVSFTRSLREAVAAELHAAEQLFARIAALASSQGNGRVRVSPRWETRARSRAFVLLLLGDLDRKRYQRAGKVSPDLDALRFACTCGDRDRWITRRASAFFRALPADVRWQGHRDARDVPRLARWLRAIGAERDAEAFERAAAPFWTDAPVPDWPNATVRRRAA